VKIGLLGKAAMAADTDTLVYSVPADVGATVNINVLNRGTETATVKVSLGTTEPPSTGDFIEDISLPAAGGVLERTAIACSAGEKIIIHASTADCVVRVHGVEEAV